MQHLKYKLKLESLDAQCLDCNNRFNDYKLSDFMYGPRIFHTETNQMVYVNLLEDSVANELSDFIDEIKPHITQDEKNALFNFLFCISCDPIDGNKVVEKIDITCSSCGGTNIKIKCQDNPTYTEFSLPVISHNHWDNKSVSEKSRELNKLLKQKLWSIL